MSRKKAIVLAIFSVWPFVYMVLAMCMVFGLMMRDVFGESYSREPPIFFMILVPLHFFTMLDIFALLVIYLVHLFKSDRVPQDKKALWAVVLFLGNMIAMPVYWYWYVWRKTES